MRVLWSCVFAVGLVVGSGVHAQSDPELAALSTVGELRAALLAQPPDLVPYVALGKVRRAAPLRVASVYVQDLPTAGYAVVHNDSVAPSYSAVALVETPTPTTRGATTSVDGLAAALAQYPDEMRVFLAVGKGRMLGPVGVVNAGVLADAEGYGAVCDGCCPLALVLVEAPRIEPPLVRTGAVPRPGRRPGAR